jgi:hypothetical protein
MFGNFWFLLIVIVGGYFAYRWYQGLETSAQSDFQSALLQDSARYLSPVVGLSPAQTVSGLQALLDGRSPPGELAMLQRIEYEVVKETEDRACRTMLVTLGTPDGPQTGKVHRRMSWNSLPTNIKEQFTNATSSRLVFVLLDRTPRQLV